MRVGIVGLGLIGGSIGLALREPSRTVLGYDPDPGAEATALGRFCIDRTAPLAEVSAADVVFVAAPPMATVPALEEVFRHIGANTVVSDCASVKGEVAQWAQSRRAPNFVGGHPMAGHEKSGAAYASAWMFRGATWILTPTKVTSKATVTTIEKLVKGMGANPTSVSAEEHDRHVAVLSHLPHAFAATLVLAADSLTSTRVAGPSWKDLTRIAGSDPHLWAQIFRSNQKELTAVLQAAEERLSELRAALADPDIERLQGFFEAAKAARERQSR